MKNTELIRGAECVMRSLPGMIPGKRCLIVTGKDLRIKERRALRRDGGA